MNIDKDNALQRAPVQRRTSTLSRICRTRIRDGEHKQGQRASTSTRFKEDIDFIQDMQGQDR